ncbi:MAG TPA: T9SS type A sorting domain-containing protein [Bacteroidales bacterium]|nr:T9SS type A sorting domain-containing protein [Bacteroidales bacterium]
MKTPILLSGLLFLLPLYFHAQVQPGKTVPAPRFERSGGHPTPALIAGKPDHLIVPVKRNMFDSSGYVWKWDTILCYKASGPAPDYRVTRKYNLSGDSLVQLTERSQSGTGYVNFARESFTFDSAGNWLSYLSEKWENNAWLNQSQKKFAYNSTSDLADWKTAWWQNNTWVNGWHYYYHYDSNGLNDTSMFQMGQDSLWVNKLLEIPSYDINGYMTSSLEYSWINNGWSATSKFSYTNDSIGNLLTWSGQVWENSSWVNSTFVTITYDSAGNRILLVTKQWQNNDWVNNELWSYTYDGNGNNIMYMSQIWSGGSWANSFRSLYLYDTCNNMLSQTSQSWNNSSWQNGDTEQYTYDAWGNSITGKYLHWYGGWQPYNGSLMVYADHQRDDHVNLIEVYRYETVLDSILVFVQPGLSQEQVTLYPNPAHSRIYISSPAASAGSHGSVTLYDLRGQVVLSQKLDLETTGIDVGGLKPGVYFVKVSNNRMTQVLKLVRN